MYFSITQRALSKCSSQLFNNITSTQLPGTLLASFCKGPSTSCPPTKVLPDPSWLDHPGGHQPALPPNGGLLHTPSPRPWHCPHYLSRPRADLHLERSRELNAWPAEERCRPLPTRSWVPPMPEVPGLTHLSTEARTLPTAHLACPRWGVLPPCTPEHDQHH